MSIDYATANPIQRGLRKVASTDPGSWVFARVAHRIDRPVFRWTRGKHTFASMATGIPVVMLTTTGAKSGVRRTTPVLGFRTDDGLVVIASNYGQEHHPAWYHNLRKHPEGVVAVDGERWQCRARQVEGEERARIWARGLEIYPGWAEYEKRAPHRRIGVFVLGRI